MDVASSAVVGREAELEQIGASLDALGNGTPSCLAFEGDPGMGKTRLLAELRARAEDRGHLVLSGAAAEFERDVPFSVWVDALDAYVASQDLSGRSAWSEALSGELGAVLPSLRPAEAERALADERYQAHRAVSTLLTVLSDHQALVLVLDDLHWSDDASIELTASLLRRWTSAPVLLALAYRPAQAPPLLAAAAASAPVQRMRIAPLSEAEAAALLGDRDAAAVADLYRHSGGNPFYLEQLARGGTGDEGWEWRASGGDEVPAAVAVSLAAELASLSGTARRVLDAAAVAGEPFEPDIAAAIAGLPDSDGLVALDELLARDFVRPTRTPRRFIFRHPLVRRAVYEASPAGWRLAAHARAAEALAVRGAAAAERAHHVEASAGRGDEEAIALLIEAGAESAPRAPAAAARWFGAALDLLPATGAARGLDVRVALASAQRSAGELDACRQTLLDAIALLPAESASRRVELTALCAAVEHWLGRHEDAHLRLERAWEELPDQGTPEGAALQIELAVDALYGLDYPRAQEMGSGALETAEALGDRALVAGAAAVLALAEATEGRIDDARAHREQAVALVDRLSDEELAPRLELLYFLGWTENYLEAYDAALAHAERGAAIARATGEGRLLVPMMLIRCYPLEMLGRLAEAVETCENAVEVARLAANPHYLFWALFELGWARYFSGNLEGAIEACEESSRMGEGRMSGGTMPSAGGGPGWALAAARSESGDVERALEIMYAVGGEGLELAIPVERCFDWEVVALAELALGRHDQADASARSAEELATQLGLGLSRALATRTRAAVLLARGDAAGAAAAARESVEAGGAAGARLQVAFSRALLGRALATSGERPAAVAELREAEAELDLCGSVRVRDECRRELRKLGARAEKRGPATPGDSGLGALTKREREIADLVTDRLTNREIAATLFLSDKTVESHLRNLFQKLGVSSRTEVARTIERERTNGSP